MSLEIIADEVHFMGYRVGLLAQTGVPATVMAELVDGINSATIFEDETKLCSECHKEVTGDYGGDPDPDAYDAALEDIERAAKEYAKNGLLRMTDLTTIINQLREESE